ncbi:hypothetical protein FOC1_g10000224, partial [Fusarium oxysporum f. sp. cubense race 1]
VYQDAPFERLPAQDSVFMGYRLERSYAMPDLLSLPDQGARKDCYAFSGEIPLGTPQTSAPLGPHRSVLVANLTLFLEQCGDLFQILSGRWVTAEHQYSPSSALNRARPQSNDVSSYLQRMRQDESFKDPSSMGILSIVDTFIQLGYLQTPEDVQEYMIIVGKEIMPDRVYVKYCPLVMNTLGMALPSGSRSPSTPRTAGPEPRKFSCPMSEMVHEEEYMQRHRNSVHKHEYGNDCLTGPTIGGYSVIAVPNGKPESISACI